MKLMDEASAAQQTPLTFSAIEARMRELPEFPSNRRRMPPPIQLAAGLISAGTILTLAASVLVLTEIPRQWLGRAATVGWWTAVIGFVPLLIYGCCSIVADLRQWTREQAERTDHQLELFLGIVEWLRGHPAARLKLLLDHARYSHTRRAARISLIAGSMDKLGILPALVSLFLALRSGGNPLAMSPWAAMVGLLLFFLWLVCWTATSARGEFQAYEHLLDMALKSHEPDQGPTNSAGSTAAVPTR